MFGARPSANRNSDDSDSMIRLRLYRTTDTERVLELWWESWHAIDSALVHPSTREGWRQRWLTEIVPTHEVIVALDDRDEIAGFAAATASSKPLSQIFVSSSRKRQGIGRALLLWAKQAMPEGFTLHTLTLNAASR